MNEKTIIRDTGSNINAAPTECRFAICTSSGSGFIADHIYVKNNAGTWIDLSKSKFVVKSADEIVSNSTTLQNDDHLTLALEANKTYYFYTQWILTSSTVADFKWRFIVPSGATMDWTTVSGADVADATLGSSASTTGNRQAFIAVTGRIMVAGTAGNVTLQWAQNTAEVSSTTMHKGSFLMIWSE